ncbi:uncharacterized protein plekhg6 isoform 2-T2 [Syngnathus typhle]
MSHPSAMEVASMQSRDFIDVVLSESDFQTETPAGHRSYHKVSPDKVKFYTLGHQMWTRQKVVSNYSTVTKGASTAAKPRAALKQVFFNQGVSDRNLTAEERSQLDVLKQELETFAVPVSLKWRWREESRGSMLENNWTDIVNSHSIMPRLQKHQQEAMWEFVLTELNYINRLIIIKDLVIAALVNLHHRGFLQEVTPEDLFSNLPAILSAHQLFWQEVIYPMLEEVRSTGKPFNPRGLEAGCLQFRERFSAYCHYCAEEETTFEFARQQMESNLHFLTYVQWVETHPQCARMRLGDMQAKPHQRITKYALLLKAVLKTTQEPEAQRSLRSMLYSVNAFLENVNEYLRLRDEEVALTISAQRLDGYEMEGINEEIDKHVRDICQFDLTCPIVGVGQGVVRKLLLEENLKVRGRKDSKLEVVALLFSDVLLMTKVQKKAERLKVVRPPLALDRTYCIVLKDNCSFLLVEVGELWCPVNAYIFTASTSESCSTWVSAIHQAKMDLRTMREAERRQSEAEKNPAAVNGTRAFILEDGLFADIKRGLPQLSNGTHASQDASGKPNHGLEILPQKFAIKEIGWKGGGKERETHPDDTLSQPSKNAWKAPDQSVPKINVSINARSSILVPGGYPDVDYPTHETNSWPVLDQTRRGGVLPGNGRIVNSKPVNYSTGKTHKPGGTPSHAESKAFSKAPMLGQKRTDNVLQAIDLVDSSGPAWSSSNSDSDCSANTKSSNPHIVLKLGALKPTRWTFWNNEPRVSPDAEIFSESELSPQYRKPKIKAERSVSIPNMSTSQDEWRVHSPDRSSSTSPLNLLQRAKGRARDRETAKSGKNIPLKALASPLTSTSASDRDGEWEEEVQLQRHRVLTVSRGWREQLVDGDGNDRMDSPLFGNGTNVDWPGWCFDKDEEAVDFVNVGVDGVMEDINQSLTLWDLSEQQDNFCSRV